jgi:hypothetical protein
MADYQIDARRVQEIRIGQQGETVATFRLKGRFVHDMKGEVGRDSYDMKLPAPWRGFRYRLEQDGRELASASRPKVKARIVSFDVEMPGRKLELIAQDQHGLLFLLLEGGEERGRFTQREFGDGDEWSADFQSREESAAFAAFVTWLVQEGRRLQG